MCLDPMTMGMTALAVGGAIVNNRAQNQAIADQQKAAISNYNSMVGQQETQQEQLNQQVSQNLSQVAMEARRESAKLDAMSADFGISGGVLDRLHNEITASASDAAGTIRHNQSNQSVQNYMQTQHLRSQTQSQINQLQSQRKTWLSTAFQIGGIGLNAYNMERQLGLQESPADLYAKARKKATEYLQ